MRRKIKRSSPGEKCNVPSILAQLPKREKSERKRSRKGKTEGEGGRARARVQEQTKKVRGDFFFHSHHVYDPLLCKRFPELCASDLVILQTIVESLDSFWQWLRDYSLGFRRLSSFRLILLSSVSHMY